MNDQQKSKQALKDAVERSARSPGFFCRFFLRHWFPTEMPAFHLGLLALITRKVEWLNDFPDAHPFLLTHFNYQADPNDPTSTILPVFQLNAEGKIIMVCGDHNNFIIPRGFSKTTLLNAANLYEAITDGTIFCVYISKSAGHAEMQLGNIRAELEGNNLLREAYGDVVPTRADLEKWQADQLQLRNGAILVARGRGGQVRGLNYRARRPNRILLDDVEDDDTAKSPTVRKDTESWYYSSVEKAGVDMEGLADGEGAQEPLRVTNLGTLLGPDCLMMTLAKDPEFNTVKFGAKLNIADNDNTEMLWATKLSHARYLRNRERHRRVGKLAEFTREIDSAIRVSDDSIFPSVFIYQPTSRADLVHVAQALDPAIADTPGSDHCALVVAGRRASDGALWFLDEWGGVGKTPREKVDQFFEFARKWQTTHNGIEAVQYQKALIFLMREEMARRGKFFHITPIFQGKTLTKEQRIVGILSPRYSNGYIRHLKPLPGLESNLADWPNGKKDYADAGSMAFTMLGQSVMTVSDADEDPNDPSKIASQHEAESAPLPPVYQTASGMIIRSRADKFNGRYG